MSTTRCLETARHQVLPVNIRVFTSYLYGYDQDLLHPWGTHFDVTWNIYN